MLISQAFAADAPVADAPATTTETGIPPNMPPPPTAMEQFVWNMGLIVVLVIMFYVLLILPQQRRFKEHTVMLSGLKKGDKVITGGGFIGTIDKDVDADEVIVDLGGGVKVTALRSSLQGKNDARLKAKPANDQKK
jgi:preprotein translocase subunit YajC